MEKWEEVDLLWKIVVVVVGGEVEAVKRYGSYLYSSVHRTALG